MMTNKTYTLYTLTGRCVFYTVFFMCIAPQVTYFTLNYYYSIPGYIFFVAFIVGTSLGFLLSQKLGLMRVDALIDTDEIIFKFYKINSNKIYKIRKAPYNIIDRFDDFAFGGDMTFKLYFKSGNTFVLSRSRIWNRKDDFAKLNTDFKKIIKHTKTLKDKKTTDFSEQATKIKYTDFFHRPISKFLFYLSIIILVLASILLMTNAIEFRSTGIPAFVGTLAYIYTYLIKNKKHNYR